MQGAKIGVGGEIRGLRRGAERLFHSPSNSFWASCKMQMKQIHGYKIPTKKRERTKSDWGLNSRMKISQIWAKTFYRQCELKCCGPRLFSELLSESRLPASSRIILNFAKLQTDEFEMEIIREMDPRALLLEVQYSCHAISVSMARADRMWWTGGWISAQLSSGQNFSGFSTLEMAIFAHWDHFFTMRRIWEKRMNKTRIRRPDNVSRRFYAVSLTQIAQIKLWGLWSLAGMSHFARILAACRTVSRRGPTIIQIYPHDKVLRENNYGPVNENGLIFLRLQGNHFLKILVEMRSF